MTTPLVPTQGNLQLTFSQTGVNGALSVTGAAFGSAGSLHWGCVRQCRFVTPGAPFGSTGSLHWGCVRQCLFVTLGMRSAVQVRYIGAAFSSAGSSMGCVR